MIADQQPHALVQAWLQHLQQTGKSQQTLRAYGRAVQHFAAWSQQTDGEPFDPTPIIGRDVRDWEAYQQRVEKAAPRTIN